MVTGSGGTYLERTIDRWARPLLHLAKACNRRRVSELAVADRMAKLIADASRNTPDGTAGPTALVAWRRRADARPPGPGGGLQAYADGIRTHSSPMLPTIANGLDVGELVETMMKHFLPSGALDVDEWRRRAEDMEGLNRQLENLPSDPDEHLR